MKLKEYIENLNEFVKENPDALDLDVLTSIDDEGNGFNMVSFSPSKGYYDGNDFIYDQNLKEYGYDDSDINAVCVN